MTGEKGRRRRYIHEFALIISAPEGRIDVLGMTATIFLYPCIAAKI